MRTGSVSSTPPSPRGSAFVRTKCGTSEFQPARRLLQAGGGRLVAARPVSATTPAGPRTGHQLRLRHLQLWPNLRGALRGPKLATPTPHLLPGAKYKFTRNLSPRRAEPATLRRRPRRIRGRRFVGYDCVVSMFRGLPFTAHTQLKIHTAWMMRKTAPAILATPGPLSHLAFLMQLKPFGQRKVTVSYLWGVAWIREIALVGGSPAFSLRIHVRLTRLLVLLSNHAVCASSSSKMKFLSPHTHRR